MSDVLHASCDWPSVWPIAVPAPHVTPDLPRDPWPVMAVNAQVVRNLRLMLAPSTSRITPRRDPRRGNPSTRSRSVRGQGAVITEWRTEADRRGPTEITLPIDSELCYLHVSKRPDSKTTCLSSTPDLRNSPHFQWLIFIIFLNKT